MKLQIWEDADGTTVTVSDAPPDVLDSEVKAAFEAAGGSTFQRACELIGPSWINLNREAATRGVRVYADF